MITNRIGLECTALNRRAKLLQLRNGSFVLHYCFIGPDTDTEAILGYWSICLEAIVINDACNCKTSWL